jgi:hypothetical protein
MSLTQQFHLLKRICQSIDCCCDRNSNPIHAPATAAALRHALRDIANSLLDQRLKGRVFSFEALHLLLDASLSSMMLLQRGCYAGARSTDASTTHIFIKLAPILYSRIRAAAASLHAPAPEWDAKVQLSDLAAQITAIKASVESVGEGFPERSQRLADVLKRLHDEPYTPIVPSELINLSMVCARP